MSSRVKPYFIILCAILVAAFLLNSPIAFATKLPTACNIFNKTQIEKSGPCGFQATISKTQSLEEGVILVSEAELEICSFIGSWNKHLSFLSPCAIISNSVPLRC